nr:l-carnitine dehydrogenase [Quercus suber]
MAQEIKTVGVVGTGVIGISWTGLFLARGLRVIVSDPAPGAEENLFAELKAMWPTLEAIGLSPGASMANCDFVGPSLAGRWDEVDFVQENAPERQTLKEQLIAEIDAGCREDVVIASSSSGIPSSQFVGHCAKNAGRVLIGHPFNPPHLMPLVEIVPHPGTHANSVAVTRAFYTLLGKKPIVLKQEIPGFVANRLQAAITAEAFSLVHRGILTAEDLDACMTTSLGPRYALSGPFMSNVMGGGGSKTGFKHLVLHIGPAMNVWLQVAYSEAQYQGLTARLHTRVNCTTDHSILSGFRPMPRKPTTTLRGNANDVGLTIIILDVYRGQANAGGWAIGHSELASTRILRSSVITPSIVVDFSSD